MVDFGSRLKELRLKSGLTQKQLSQQLGVTKSVVSYYELQSRTPSPDVLVKLARIFKVSTDYLLGLDDRIMLDVTGLNDSDIGVIQQMIDALKDKGQK